MRLYLDDDTVAAVLIRLLRGAGHDIRVPVELGLSGSHDAIHLRHAIRENRVLLTHNYRDFNFLHELVMEAGGHHPGILMVRRDSDVVRNLKPRDIVRAIANLPAAGIQIVDQVLVLNHWR